MRPVVRTASDQIKLRIDIFAIYLIQILTAVATIDGSFVVFAIA